MSEMPASVQQAIDIVEDECFLNDFSPVEKTKSRKILWRVGNIIRDRIKASAAARCSADSERPVAWRVTAGGNSERHLFDEERYAKLMRKDLEENGWLDVEMVPLYAAVPQASAVSDDAAYRKAIDDALVTRHIGVAQGNARDELHAILSWEVGVALDPRVSEAAQSLIDQGRTAPQASADSAQPQKAMIVTYTISIDKDGNVYNDTQTHGSSFADVYRAFIAIKAEVDRQLDERRNCPCNPKYAATKRI
jgi:hypothetical protein